MKKYFYILLLTFVALIWGTEQVISEVHSRPHSVISLGDEGDPTSGDPSQDDSSQDDPVEEGPCQTFYQFDTLRFPNTEVREWHDQLIDRSGTYFDHFVSDEGCDTIYQLTAFMHPTFLYELDTAVCENDLPFVWRGMECASTNVYEERFPTALGFDSVYRLNLTVLPAYVSNYSITLCPGHTVEYAGQRYSKPGVYTQVLYSENGCDSIMKVVVSYKDYFLQIDSVGINDGQSYTWPVNGVTYDKLGTYEVRETSINGCDSIYRLELFRNKKYFFPETVKVCHPDTLPWYIWHDLKISEPGVYWDSLYTTAGQDSVYQLTIDFLMPTDTFYHVDVCGADSYLFGGKLITENGFYEDTIANVVNCDSIIRIYVNFLDLVEERWDTICDGDTLFWHGDTLTMENYYEKHVPDTLHEKCDSVFKLHLTMVYPFMHNYSDTICEHYLLTNEPYLWGPNKRELWGKWNDETGHYEDSIYWNCGHTNYFHLRVLPERYSMNEIPLCQGDFTTRVLHTGETLVLSEPGYYYDTIPSGPDHSLFACDSIACFHVTVHPTYRDTVEKQFDTNDLPLKWNELDVTGPGYYTANLQTAQAKCDSIVVLAASTITYQSTSICEGDSLDFYGRFVKEKGNYTYTFAHESGLDSLIMLTLNMNPSYQMTQSAHVSDQQGYTWKLRDADGTNHDRVFKVPVTPGVYTDTVKSSHDCDSIITLTLQVHPTYRIPDTIRVCQSELPYAWRNKQLMESNDYVDNLMTKTWGYDSIYTLHFEVLPTYQTKQTINRCYGETYQFNNVVYTAPGLYRDTIGTRMNGCDSIFIIDFKWYDSYRDTLYAQCDDKHLPYKWKVGNTIRPLDHAGTYSDTLKTKHNCDSIVVMQLTVYQTYLFPESIVACPSELPYQWRNKQLSKSGDYADSLTTVLGHDSIYTVHFTVLPTYEEELRVNICNGEPYQFNNKEYTRPGVYRDTLPTKSYGCDSVFVINLTWKDTYHTVVKGKCADNQLPYSWHVGDMERSIDHAGSFFETLESTQGCDSVVELQLMVYETYLFPENVRVCASELPYQWRSQQLTIPGQYEEKLTTTLGYDSIYQVNFSVLDTAMTDIYYDMCYGGSYEFGHRVIREAGIYQDTLKNGLGCDSVVTLHLQVRPQYAIAQTAAIPQGGSYLWEQNGKVYTQTGTYADTLVAINGCDSVIALHLLVYDKEVIFNEGTKDICIAQTPYLWHGHYLTESNVYYDTVRTPATDTIHVITLRVMDLGSQFHEALMCDGEVFEWNGKYITRDTIYHDIEETGLGCGTDHTIYVRFRKAQTQVFNVQTDDKHPYYWSYTDKSYSTSGTYRYTLRTKDDLCDSVRYVLNLTVGPTYSDTAHISLCENELPYLWHGQAIKGVGVYTDSLETVLHYDSAFMLIVDEILPVYRDVQYIHLCSNSGPYIYRGKPYSEPGIFHDTVPALTGCDSIFEIHVRVFPTKESMEQVDISDKQTPYLWNGQSLTKSGWATANLKTTDGCDSIVRLLLTIHPTHRIVEPIETCDNEPITWHGKTYSEPGTYYDSLSTVTWGYDSIHVLELTVRPTYFIDEHVQIVRGATTTIHGLDISKEGTYMDTLTSVHGCDSVYRITANYARAYCMEYNDTICSGDTYTFYGRTYTQSETLREVLGPDSLEICHLVVLNKAYEEKRVVLFPGQFPYIHDGVPYDEPGTYTFSHKTVAHNCDSTFRLILIRSEHCSEWDYQPLCAGTTLQIDSFTITQAGSYAFLYRSKISGELDSLYRVEVYNAPAYDLPVEYREICQGDTVVWNGKQYFRTGDYELRGKTIDGCDSIAHLHLTVHPTYQFFTDATIPDYESYKWRGNEYSRTGDYDRVFQTQEGCDSVYTLRLQVMHTDRQHYVDTICQGDIYVWRGKTYTRDGIYTDTLRVDGSLTSAIYTLELHVTRPTIITNAYVTPICADAESFDVEFSYSGATPTNYSVIFDAHAQRYGFVNVHNAPYKGRATVPMPVHRQTIYEGHTDYVRPDNYSLRLMIDNGACGVTRSDSILIQVRYPSWIIEQSWQDVVAPLRPEYNGGYVFRQHDWYVNGSKVNMDGLPYLYSSYLRPADEVVLYATRDGENYAIPTCPLVIVRYTSDNTATPVVVSPTVAPRHAPVVTLSAPDAGTYSLYSVTGRLLRQGTFIQGDMELTLPAVEGYYLMQTTLSDGTKQTLKLLVK